MSSQQKLLLANAETRTDSAPSVLPSQSTAVSIDMRHLSQSVSGVGLNSARQWTVPCGQDVVSTATNSDRNVTAAGTCQLPQLSAPVVLPPDGRAMDTVQTPMDSDAAEQHSCTLTDDAVANVASFSSPKCSHDKAVERTDPTTESNLEYHEDTVHSDVVSSVTPAPTCNIDTDLALKVNASNVVCSTNQAPCTSDETASGNIVKMSVLENAYRSVLTAVGPAEMPCVEKPDSTLSGSFRQPQSAASPSMTVTGVSEENSMSVTEGDQLSAVVNDVGSRSACCDAVADYASTDESHSTLDDAHLVLNCIVIVQLFLSDCLGTCVVIFVLHSCICVMFFKSVNVILLMEFGQLLKTYPLRTMALTLCPPKNLHRFFCNNFAKTFDVEINCGTRIPQ